MCSRLQVLAAAVLEESASSPKLLEKQKILSLICNLANSAVEEPAQTTVTNASLAKNKVNQLYQSFIKPQKSNLPLLRSYCASLL